MTNPILPPSKTTTTAAAAVKDKTPPPSTISKVTTSDNKSNPPPRKTSLSDLEKELQEFDIDVDKDDVSDVELDQATGAYKKTDDEEAEVKLLQ